MLEFIDTNTDRCDISAELYENDERISIKMELNANPTKEIKNLIESIVVTAKANFMVDKIILSCEADKQLEQYLIFIGFSKISDNEFILENTAAVTKLFQGD